MATESGSYYNKVYSSFSGGRGYARYSRVYTTTPNIYPTLYNYMFKWFETKSYKVYKSSPFNHISLCKNYEADENGTYLGLFTCPLPFVPSNHAYCCGVTNAQYCCTFWDLPYNYAAAVILMTMGCLFLICLLYVLVMLIIEKWRKEYGESNRTFSWQIKLKQPETPRRYGKHEPKDYNSCYYDNSLHRDIVNKDKTEKTTEVSDVCLTRTYTVIDFTNDFDNNIQPNIVNCDNNILVQKGPKKSRGKNRKRSRRHTSHELGMEVRTNANVLSNIRPSFNTDAA